MSSYMHPAYTPASSPSVRVRVAMRGHSNPPMGRSVSWAQHICTSPAPSFTGAVGAISEIVASANNNVKFAQYQKVYIQVRPSIAT